MVQSAPRIIQTHELLNQRMLDQLTRRKVDVGQYYGGRETAQAWAVLARHHPMKEFTGLTLDGDDRVTVVDIGPGSGIPCVAAVEQFANRVADIICVDASADMADQAARHIAAATSRGVHCIIADFLLDAVELRESLNAVPTRKLLLCLGGTAGNFAQKRVMSTLRSFLAHNDRILFGLGLYDEGDSDQELRLLADFFISETNCRFGLQFLRACGATPGHQHAFARCEDDCEAPGVKVVRAIYRFPEETVLDVAERPVTFRKSEELQFVESRRYPRNGCVSFLRSNGFDPLACRDFGRHGLFLCGRN